MAGKIKRVELSTFKCYGQEAVIGHKTQEINGKTYVTFMWCKLCAKYKDEILSKLKGSVKESAVSFIDGTNVVSKYQLFRHIDKSQGHQIALERERMKPVEERSVAVKDNGAMKQKRVDHMTNEFSKIAYEKLIRTAYQMCLNPTIPVTQFKTFVKVLRINGVRLVTGHDNAKTAREMIHCIYACVIKKCAELIQRENFMSVLSDGSQARKTGSDKEMVLTRTNKDGSPAYYVSSLLNMEDWGGSDAESLKNGIDHIYSDSGNVPLQDYTTKLIGMTTDGASVNTGCRTGLVTRVENDGRDWLVKIHCANHRIELAVKEACKNTALTDIDDLYQIIFSLMKNSGKIKSGVKAACAALDIQHYTLSKLTGTRFVGHRRTAFKRLLAVWPAIITTFDNVIADEKTKADTRAKVIGIQRKMKSYRYLCLTCVYLDVLELITPASKIFEGEGLYLFELDPVISETVANMEDAIECTGTEEENLTSHLASFPLIDDNVVASYIKASDPRRNISDKETIQVTLSDLTFAIEQVRLNTCAIKKDVLMELKDLLLARFDNINSDIFTAMKWFDHKNWLPDRDYAVNDLLLVADRFSKPLLAADFKRDRVITEWKAFKNHVNARYMTCDFRVMWRKIFFLKKKEFRNICLLAEIVIALSGSNSTVERAFSCLTMMLSDKRLSMKHKTMEQLLTICINDKLFNDVEKEEIIKESLEFYLRKRRTQTMDDDIPVKVCRLEVFNVSDEDGDEESGDDDENEDFFITPLSDESSSGNDSPMPMSCWTVDSDSESQ